MGVFGEVASQADAGAMLTAIAAEFDQTDDPAVRAVLIRLADVALELNDWTQPEYQKRIVDRMKRA